MYNSTKRQLREQAQRRTPNHLDAIWKEASDLLELPVQKTRTRNCSVVKRAAAAVLAVVFLLGAVVWTDHAKPTGLGLVVVSAAKDGKERQTVFVRKKAHVELPVKARLQVVDLRGMDAAQRAAACDEAFWQTWHYLHDEPRDGVPWGSRSDATENVYVSYAFLSDFMLDGIDTARMSSLQITLSGIGMLEINNASYGEDLNQYEREYVISAADFCRLYSSRSESGQGMRINWMLSDALFDKLDRDPTTPLSDICDTITFTVVYTDGSEDSFQVQVTFDDAGTMHATYIKN